MDLNEMLIRKPGVGPVLMKKVKEYYADESHEAAFRQWFEEKYGYEYEPKRRTAI